MLMTVSMGCHGSGSTLRPEQMKHAAPAPPPAQPDPSKLLAELSAGDFEEAERTIAEFTRLGDRRHALLGELLLAARHHDAKRLEAVANSSQVHLLREVPRFHASLALALYWTVDVRRAAGELAAVCASAALPPDDVALAKACALAAQARLIGDKPLWEVEGPAEGSVDFLQGKSIPIILASVNGLKPEYFIVDTGAATSVLSKAYCDRAAISYLADHPMVSRDGGGNEVRLYPAVVDRLEVGGIVVRNFTAHVIDLPPNFKIGGILSPQDTFRTLSAELDMRKNQLRLHRSSAEAWKAAAGEPTHSTPLFWDDGNVLVKASVEGSVAKYFLFDTGAGANFISLDLAQALGKSPPKDGLETATAGGSAKVFQGFEANFAVGESPPVRTQLMMKDRSVNPHDIAPLATSGYVGTPWMSGRRLFLPAGGRSLLFTDVQQR